MPAYADDPFDLARFVSAQERDYAQALRELRSGRKQSHWIWYVLPQLRGLGMSGMSQRYGVSGLEEARAYLAHPVLGPRLVECVEAISAHQGRAAAAIMGDLDAMKYQSCLTLFASVSGDAESVFAMALQSHFAGVRDGRTVQMLSRSQSDARPGSA